MLIKSEDAMCGSFHKIDIMFEYYENNLQRDISAR